MTTSTLKATGTTSGYHFTIRTDADGWFLTDFFELNADGTPAKRPVGPVPSTAHYSHGLKRVVEQAHEIGAALRRRETAAAALKAAREEFDNAQAYFENVY